MIYVVKNKSNNHYLPDRGVFISKGSPDIDTFGFTKNLQDANVYYSIKSANNAIQNASGIYHVGVGEEKIVLNPSDLEIKEVKLTVI